MKTGIRTKLWLTVVGIIAVVVLYNTQLQRPGKFRNPDDHLVQFEANWQDGIEVSITWMAGPVNNGEFTSALGHDKRSSAFHGPGQVVYTLVPEVPADITCMVIVDGEPYMNRSHRNNLSCEVAVVVE